MDVIEKVRGLMEQGELTSTEKARLEELERALNGGHVVAPPETRAWVEKLHRREFFAHEMVAADDVLERRAARRIRR